MLSANQRAEIFRGCYYESNVPKLMEKIPSVLANQHLVILLSVL